VPNVSKPHSPDDFGVGIVQPSGISNRWAIVMAGSAIGIRKEGINNNGIYY
jgi:hypothetical protein